MTYSMVHKCRDNNGKKNVWRDTMIVKYAYLVRHIAARFASRIPSNVLFDDLVSAGSFGLIDAVDKFDHDKHVNFKTYAQYRIKGAILDELRSMDVYSRSMRKKIKDIAKAVKKVECEHQRPAEDSDIASKMGIDLDTYFDMLTDIHCASILSLDAFIKSGRTNSTSQTRFQSRLTVKETPADHLDREEMKTALSNAVKTLTEKEQIVVSLYYYEELTLKEIGEVLSLTESRICQIHAGILIKMKTKLKDYFNS